MRNKFPGLLLLLGTALVITALSLYGYNRWEDAQAGKRSAESLSALRSQMETREEPRETVSQTEAGELTPEECEMPEVTIQGNAYIGYLTIPDLELELPVISKWDYDRLQTAPCRYEGTMKGENLVLLAHNYDQHFGRLDELPVGAAVDFTDMEDTTYHYTVALQEILDGADVEGMTSREYALSLFTCTRDSRSRIVVRCERIEKEKP